MKNYYQQLIERIVTDSDAARYLQAVGAQLLTDDHAAITDAADAYTSKTIGIEAAAASLHPLADARSIPHRTMDFVFVACASKQLRERFRIAGYDDALFWQTIADLDCKLAECHTVYGEWGVDCLLWYDHFFEMRLFWLGRLQYERRLLPSDVPITVGEYTLQPGDTVYSVHIPSCGPLTRDARLDSYRRAYKFFKEERGDKPLFCCCLSWLLFPANREIFPPHLNTVDFMNDFKIVGSDHNNFRDLWRVFGVPFEGDLSALPRDNTMRRAFGAWLDNGGQPGYGIGYFAFDGEKLINN